MGLGMNVRFAKDLKIFSLALVGGLAVALAQSCDEKSTRERSSMLPGGQPAAPAAVDGAAPSSRPSVDGKESPPPLPCSQGGEACPAGFMCCPQCCLANLPPVCVPVTDGGCPLPDLTVDEGALATKTYLETIDGTKCEVDEGCLGGPGKRKVVRFDAQVPNRGTTDLVLGNPDAGGPFVFAECHKHYHFTGFAHYRLVSDDDNKVVLTARKQAFCARDSARVDQSAPFNPRYDCTSQGIQVGWSDVYDPTLPCQFLDVTDVPSGTYRLEVEVNPERTITESRYDNNLASIKIKLP
jgi:hypothetical protein